MNKPSRAAPSQFSTLNSQLPKAGYKQTEVGVIPEDWEVHPLVDLANVRSGIAKNSNVSVNNPVFVHYLRVANVQDGFLDLSEMSKILMNANNIQKYSVLPGDILMNEGGDLDQLGRGHIWQGEFSPCVHQNHVFVVRCKPALNPDYLNSWTGGKPARRFFLIAGKQTTNLASINKTALGQLPVALPTLAEQEAIAGALSDADEWIAALTRLIAKKRQIKQATMQSLLNPYENGQLKPGWVEKKLGDVAGVYSGGTPNTSVSSYYNGEIPWITSGDLNKGIIEDVSGRISQIGLNNSSAKMINKNTLLIALYGATSGVSAISKIEAAINQAVLAIITNSSTSNIFLLYLLTHLKHWIIDTYTQGGQPNLSGTIIKSIDITIPTKDEQTAIATILSDMDAQIAALEGRLGKARHIKQGMMSELLTGKTRLI